MKKFELKAPEGADESLKTAYKSLSEVLTTAFNDNKKESLEAMQEALKEWGEKNSVSKEELEKINNVIKAQGEAGTVIFEELTYRIRTLESCDPHVLFEKDVQTILHDTLGSLDRKTGRIFSLSRFDGMTNREIAMELGISEKTVEYHISKALKVLRVALKDYLPLVGIFLGL